MTTSPFLRLPAELREKIYVYVLGGNTIHIGVCVTGSGTAPLCHAICRAPISDKDILTHYHQDRHVKVPSNSVYERHELCKDPADHATLRLLSLALLRTCRQIYREAACVPYAENTFSFGDPWLDHLPSDHPDYQDEHEWTPPAYKRFEGGLPEKQQQALSTHLMARSPSSLYRTLLTDEERQLPTFPLVYIKQKGKSGLWEVVVYAEFGIMRAFRESESSSGVLQEAFVDEIEEMRQDDSIDSVEIRVYSALCPVPQHERDECKDMLDTVMQMQQESGQPRSPQRSETLTFPEDMDIPPIEMESDGELDYMITSSRDSEDNNDSSTEQGQKYAAFKSMAKLRSCNVKVGIAVAIFVVGLAYFVRRRR